MADSFMYGAHPQRNVVLSASERDTIVSATPPIHVFWNVLHKIKNPDRWPDNRTYSSSSGKTISAVFVTYQSAQEPLPELGLPGDTWLTDSCIYLKDTQARWIRWELGHIYQCPYETGRRMVWSRSLHIKYLAQDTAKTERRRWDDTNDGPLSHVLTQPVLAKMPEASEALGKKYDRLTEADCVVLLTAHCASQRGLFDAHKGQESCEYSKPLDEYESKGSIHCPNGMEVFLPYTNRKENEPESSHVLACKWLLSGEDAATAPAGGPSPIGKQPILTVLEAPPPRGSLMVWSDLKRTINDVVSTGRVTVVKNVLTDGPSYGWDEPSLCSIMRREADGGIIRWQSALKNEELEKASKVPETVSGTVRDFLEASRNPKDSVNCLDIPTFFGDVPWIIQEISTSSRALSNTSSVTLEFSRAIPRKPDIAQPTPVANTGSQMRRAPRRKRSAPRGTSQAKKKARKKTSQDRAPSRVTSSSEDDGRDEAHDMRRPREEPEQPPLRPGKRGMDEIFEKYLTYVNSKGGMHSIEYDVVKTASWSIVASTGAVSQTHLDAGGFATWLRCVKGAKIWGYVVPKDNTEKTTEEHPGENWEGNACGEQPLDELAKAMQAYHQIADANTEPRRLMEIAKPLQILLRPDTLVIQPPGVFHVVYTVKSSIFTCGHCYILDAMHLTEVCRACAAFSAQAATNASHPGSIRLLSRVALSIAFDNKSSVLRKPFISLARMLLWAHVYALGDVDPEDSNFKYDSESLGEQAAAQAVVEAILEHNDIRMQDIQPEPLENFHWLSRIGEGEDWKDWRDPGTISLEVPDMRRYFFEYEQMLDEKETRLHSCT